MDRVESFPTDDETMANLASIKPNFVPEMTKEEEERKKALLERQAPIRNLLREKGLWIDTKFDKKNFEQIKQ